MSRALIWKTLRDADRLNLACVATIIAFSWIRVKIVGSMELYQFRRIARNLPEMIQRMLPVSIDQFVSYPGLVSFTFEEPLTYLIMALWTISRASDVVSGELGRGTMELILAQPISRLRYLTIHTMVTLLGVVLIAIGAWIGTWAGVQTTKVKLGPAPRGWLEHFQIPAIEVNREDNAIYAPMAQQVQMPMLSAAVVNYACLGFLLTGLTTAVSAANQSRSRTIGMVVGVYVVQTVMELAGMTMIGAKWLLYGTFFSAYEPVAQTMVASRHPQQVWSFWAATSHGRFPDLGPLGCDAVLLVWATLGLVLGAVIFCRRDLPAPL